MAMVINSNIMSLNAQRNLTLSQGDQNQAMERLTSGKRINSAADDAAGLAISNRMTSQVRGLDQAVRNANDGISVIQTAEGALDETTNILQRMRELSIQSANGTYDDGNRGTLNAEVQQLVAEIDRIAETTAFNGLNILDGTLGKVDLQVGSEANQTISLEIQGMDSQSLGLGSTSGDLTGASINAALAFDDGDIQINGQALDAVNLGGTDTLDDLVSNINSLEGVSATAFNVLEGTATTADGVMTAAQSFDIVVGSTDGSGATTFSIGGSADSATTTMDELVSVINDKTGGAVTASINEDNGRIVLSNSTGGTITLNNFTGVGASNIGFTSGDSQTGSLSITADDGGAVTITKGANGTDTDLANFGFREVGAAGEVLGSSISSTDQVLAISTGDLTINGTKISGENTTSLQGKIDNINAVSDDTGVTASSVAQESFSVDVSRPVIELAATAAVNTTTLTTNDDLTLNGVAVSFAGDTNGADVADAINTGTANHGVSAYVDDSGNLHLASDSPFTIAGTDTAGLGGGTATNGTKTTAAASALGANGGSIEINGYDITNLALDSVDNLVSEINAQSGNTGVTASIDDNGELQFTGSSAITIKTGDTQGIATFEALGITGTTDSNADGFNDTYTINPRIKLDSANDAPISVEVKDAATATRTGLQDMNTDLGSTVAGTAISNIDISTAAGAQAAIGSIDQALETINETRGDLGAINNRLDFTVNNLSNVSENVAAARSRIEDADFAAESAALSRAQVLQQAGTAMLAQANAAPQQVLSLLQ